MQARLLLLGTGTCQLEPDRTSSAVLVELPEVRLVHDFGRGTAGRLVQAGLRQDDVEHVVLSHFHPDHLSDLIPYLHAACWSRVDPRQRDLHVWGPPGLEVQLMRLLSLFEAGTLTRETFRVHLHERRAGPVDIGGLPIELVPLPPAGNHGLRFRHAGRTVALTGDSDFHPQEVAFLAGADLAVIDAGHLSDEQIVDLAVASGAADLVCSHLYRELDLQALAGTAAERGFSGRLRVGYDGMELPLG